MKLIKDIFTEGTTGRYSSSKFWFNVGNASIVYTYLLFAHKMTQSPGINVEGIAILTLVMSGILTGNKLATFFIKSRYGKEDDKSNNASVTPEK